MKAYSIMRHAKIKAGKHLVGVGLHNARGADTPNAVNVPGLEPVFMIGSDRPHDDVMRRLRDLGIVKLKGGKAPANVAVEIMIAASPEWWASKGWKSGETPSPETRAVIDGWRAEVEGFLREVWGDNLVSLALHLDEASPHCQALATPAIYRADGREKKVQERDAEGVPTGKMIAPMAWRLSTETFLKGPRHLKELQSRLAKRMGKFGLVRGQDVETGTVWHKPLAEWQREQADAAVVISSAVLDQVRLKGEAQSTRDELSEQVRKVGELVMEQERLRKQAEADAAALIAAAKVEADRIVAAARKRDAEQAELEAAAEAERRRKADDARTLELRVDRARVEVLEQRKAVDAEWQAVKAEKAAVASLKEKLDRVLAKAEALLKPIMAMANQWRTGSPLVRQALGLKGPKAIEIADSVEVQTLMRMRGGAGTSR